METIRRYPDNSGIQVIDLRTGDAAHWLRIEGVVGELYDVVALPGVRRPMALRFKTDEIRQMFGIGQQVGKNEKQATHDCRHSHGEGNLT